MPFQKMYENPPMSAEARFREAFERLKCKTPRVVGVDAMVTQANIAREAGCDPSALKKMRYPILVAEIQEYLNVQQKVLIKNVTSKSSRSSIPLGLMEKVELLTRQRDHALSLLLEADNKILELSKEISDLRRGKKNSEF